MTRTIRRGVAPLALVLIVILALAWWLNRDMGEPTPFMKPPAVDGRNIEVKYIGSECQDGSRLDVTEESDRVVLTVFAWEDASGCSDVGVTYELHATLSEDLGGRELVDGACEMADFQRYGDCRGS